MQAPPARLVLIAALAGAVVAAAGCAGFWTTPEQRAQIPGTIEYNARIRHEALTGGLIPTSAGSPFDRTNPILNMTVRDGVLYPYKDSPTPIGPITGAAAHSGPLIP